jgi:hypothetical protein
MSGIAQFIGNNALSVGCTGAGFAGIWSMAARDFGNETGAVMATVTTLGLGVIIYQAAQLDGYAAPFQATVRVLGVFGVFPAIAGAVLAHAHGR